jgi:aldehyde dehydrogenase (NAD+)
MNTDFLKSLQLRDKNEGSWCGAISFPSVQYLTSYSPVDGTTIGDVGITTESDYNQIISKSQEAFKVWRTIPAPKRGEIVREIGDELMKYKDQLGKLVSYEMGKSLQEGLGEVQEMIDICYFATGLSRQLYGLTMHSERPMHRMYEQWHPLGIVGVISAFNFPVAVWSWNAALAWVCGNVVIWKPSEKTPLCSIACQNIVQKIFAKHQIPDGVSSIINGDYKVGEYLTKDSNVALVSATGSTRMGQAVGTEVAKRFGKSILELGGNNAIIVTPSADLKVVMTSVVFGAVGTAGQRCTSTRRLIMQVN